MKRVIFPVALVICIYLLFQQEDVTPWLPPSLTHPLGSDEFGRDILGTLAAAAMISTLKAIVLTISASLPALLVGCLIALSLSPWVALVLRGIVITVESVPAVFWVLILIAMLAEARLAVVAAAFTIAILPITTNVIAGEVVRLREAPFVQAARALGVSESRIILRHIIPNVVAVLGPLFLQILGAAIAIDGAVGLLGLGNRTQLDIGILLLRGKENAFLYPHLLIGVIATITLIYCWLFLLIRAVSQKSSLQSSFLFS